MVNIEQLKIGDGVQFSNANSHMFKILRYEQLMRHGVGITGRVTNLKPRDYDGIPIEVTWNTPTPFKTWVASDAIDLVTP